VSRYSGAYGEDASRAIRERNANSPWGKRAERRRMLDQLAARLAGAEPSDLTSALPAAPGSSADQPPPAQGG
jgi:hypothetical protein